MLSVLLYAFLIGLALVLQVIVHELGHTLAARAFGDRKANFRLFVVEEGRFAGLGLATVSQKFSPQQEMVIDLSGVGLSWLAASVLWWLAPSIGVVSVPSMLFLLVFYLFLRLNFLLYVVRDGLVNGILRQRQLIGDITVFVERLTAIWGVRKWVLYLGCFLLGLVDAAFIGVCVRHLAAIWGGWAE